MKRDLQWKGVQLQQGEPSQPAAANSQPIALWTHSKLLGSMQMAFHFNTVSLQAPSDFGICLENSSPLLLPSNILWLFYQNAHLRSQCCSFFLSNCEYFHIGQKIRPSDIHQELGCDTVRQARHRTTSTDNLVPPYSPPNKKTTILTHRQTSTPLSKCH